METQTWGELGWEPMAPFPSVSAVPAKSCSPLASREGDAQAPLPLRKGRTGIPSLQRQKVTERNSGFPGFCPVWRGQRQLRYLERLLLGSSA